MAERKKTELLHTDADQPVRLNKFLSDAGVCSRRQADRFIEDGRVFVDGRTAGLGSKVLPGQTVTLNGQTVTRSQKLVLLAFHKPAGIECTTAADNPANIVDYIGYPERIYPIGRLDKNSTGLILLTNTGELSDSILRSVNEHEKEYQVRVDKKITKEFLAAMRAGVYLKELQVTTKKCRVRQTGNNTFSIILTQGLNRQIRRMCDALGYHVVRLHRVRIMNLLLGDLKEGRYRHVTDQELNELLAALKERKEHG